MTTTSTATTVHDVLDAYVTVERNPHSGTKWVYDAAMSLPQTRQRAEVVAMADGIVRGAYAAGQWRAGLTEAAYRLRELIVIHDNGGAASSPAKIKDAAADLLALLGEGVER